MRKVEALFPKIRFRRAAPNRAKPVFETQRRLVVEFVAFINSHFRPNVCHSSPRPRPHNAWDYMMAADMKLVLGNAIKQQRSALGISQEELAARAGLHRTYVSEVERGERNPSIMSVDKLAQALGTSITSLLNPTLPHSTPGEALEILLVEDNPIDVELTKSAFQKAQVKNTLHVVNDGETALDFVFARGSHASRANARPPRLILLDLNLPKKSGVEVLKEIKQDPRTQNIPVIVLTISESEHDISECRRLGAETYIVKPVSFQNFTKVTTVLSLSWVLVEPNGTLSVQPNLMTPAAAMDG